MAAGGSSIQGQVLEMTIAGCHNLSNKEWFSRQDPYVIVEYAGQKFRTRTCTDGGRVPSFNETCTFSLIDGLREVNASVWNSNTIKRDDYIGSTRILLSKVIGSGFDNTQWSLSNDRTGKSSGVLSLILHFAGAKTNPAEAPPAIATAGQGAPACGLEAPACGHGAPACRHGASSCYHGPPACGHGASVYGQGASVYGQGAYGAAVPPQQPYPPPSGGYGPPPAYMPFCQVPTAAPYPPQPAAHVGAQPSYYSAPPMYSPASAPPMYPPASAPPMYPPASAPPMYPPASAPPMYPPAGYPQYR